MLASRWCLIFATLCIAACNDRSVTPAGQKTAPGSISIATDATFPPFHYIDDDGRVTGFDVELARQLAERAGFETEVEVVSYDILFDGLLENRYDVVAATTGIIPERESKYLFSESYFDTCQAVLVRAGKNEPQSLADLTGRRVGAAGAGTSVKALHQLHGAIPLLLSNREATEATILADGRVPVLEGGDIDALVVDELDAVDAARRSDGRLRVLAEPVALEQYGFVFAKGRIELKQAFDKALVEMRTDGSLGVLQQNFGLDRGDDWPVKLPREGEN